MATFHHVHERTTGDAFQVLKEGLSTPRSFGETFPKWHAFMQ